MVWAWIGALIAHGMGLNVNAAFAKFTEFCVIYHQAKASGNGVRARNIWPRIYVDQICMEVEFTGNVR